MTRNKHDKEDVIRFQEDKTDLDLVLAIIRDRTCDAPTRATHMHHMATASCPRTDFVALRSPTFPSVCAFRVTLKGALSLAFLCQAPLPRNRAASNVPETVVTKYGVTAVNKLLNDVQSNHAVQVPERGRFRR